MRRGGPFAVVLVGALALVLAFLILPVVAIFANTAPSELIDSLGSQASQDALWLSLKTTLIALVVIVVVGTPAAYLLATREFRGKAVVVTAIELPLVLPPAVAGIGLLAAFGPKGILGPALSNAGIELVLQTAGVIVALVFVSAPFYLRQAQAAFEAVDRDLPRRRANPRRRRGAVVLDRRDSLRRSGHHYRRRTGLGTGAGRVRGDADVRRVVSGHHADGAPGDLRELRHRFPRRARAVGRARRRLGRAAFGGEAARPLAAARRSAGVTAERLSVAIASRLRAFEVDVDLDVADGDCLALVGPSGAGKSTVLRAIAGLHRPDRGSVQLGTDVWFDRGAGVDLPPERRGCGYVFQDYALFPHLNAWRNVAYGLSDTPRAQRRAEAVAALDRFGAGALAEAPAAKLSGGERQRIALARALACRPRAILLDEPLSALDSRTASAAASQLGETLAAAEAPAVLVTHDFAQAALLASEVAVIDRGRIVQRGSAAELSARPASAFVADFAGASVMLGTATSAAGGTTRVALDGGGEVFSSQVAEGEVGVAVFPWEVVLERPGSAPHGSALNRLDASVVSVTEVGNRARVGLLAGQPLAAEVTGESVASLGLAPGSRVVATWKATATRLVAR